MATRVALAGVLTLAQLVGAKRGEIERQAKAVANVFAHVLGSVV